ncbi:hypothetical protein F1880_004921 [Penicillium rolfsii]|nr:hypothetical protein F1880_004921 [Penicillium rolfsii]
MLRTKLEDRNVAGHNSHNKILDIESVSPNLTGTVQNEDRKDIASCNRAIFSLSEKALVSLDTLAIFPQTELSIEVEHVRKSLHKIMPLEIIQHISEDSSRCPAWTAKGCRCRNKHSTGPIISSIRKLPSLEMNGLLPQIQSLINSTLCSTHRKVAFREIEKWKADFANLTTVPGPRDSSFSLHDWRLLAIASWIRLMSKDVAPQTEKSAPPLPKINTEPGSKIQQFNPIQVFKPYITTARAEKLAEDIMKLVQRPLLPSEINQAGFIYIFWQVGNFGHMKIGRSTDVDRRLKEWEKQCKKKIDVHFPDMKAEEDHEDLQQIPHICRVEALVHMELLEHRRIEKKCPGCSKSHKEYFEISKDIAIQVVRNEKFIERGLYIKEVLFPRKRLAATKNISILSGVTYLRG